MLICHLLPDTVSNLQNIGAMKKWGYEFTTNASIISNKDWGWELGGNASYQQE